jgi:GntR family transcriptional regulator/MocR family aminotransferase
MRVRRQPVIFPKVDRSMRGVAEAVREAIEEGRLTAGAALPSTRDLARQLGVARNTVLGAIDLLAGNAILETRPGVGTFVCRQLPLAQRVGSDAPLEFPITGWAKRLPASPITLRDVDAPIDFRPGLPDLRTIPFDEWRRSASRKLKTLRREIGSYGTPEGNPDLRREITLYVARSRGVTCTADDVIVTAGAQQAFDLITRVLVQPGAQIAMEDPGYPIAAQVFESGGATLCGVPVDGEGLDPALIPDGCAMAYVSPSHQYPLGVTMSDRRRQALLSWADRAGAFIIEDDYDSEFVYSPQALPALRSRAGCGRVIYVGTFSKTLMPGIRLGFIIVPSGLRRVFLTAKWITDRHSDNISQAVLAEFMASGQFGRHVTRMRDIYAERHAVIESFREAFSEAGHTLLPSCAGLHACLLLADATREGQIIAAALRAGVGLHGLGTAARSSSNRPGLVLGFGNLEKGPIARGLQVVLRLLGER